MARAWLEGLICIERHLFWKGRVSRKDIASSLQVSESTAAKMLGAYRKTNPGGMVLRSGRAGYWMPAEEFAPLFYRPVIEDSNMPVEKTESDGFARSERMTRKIMSTVAGAFAAGECVVIELGPGGSKLLKPLKWIMHDGNLVSLVVRSQETQSDLNIAIESITDISASSSI